MKEKKNRYEIKFNKIFTKIYFNAWFLQISVLYLVASMIVSLGQGFFTKRDSRSPFG